MAENYGKMMDTKEEYERALLNVEHFGYEDEKAIRAHESALQQRIAELRSENSDVRRILGHKEDIIITDTDRITELEAKCEELTESLEMSEADRKMWKARAKENYQETCGAESRWVDLHREFEAFKAKVLESKRVWIWWMKTASGDWIVRRVTEDKYDWNGQTFSVDWDRIEQVYAVPVDAVGQKDNP